MNKESQNSTKSTLRQELDELSLAVEDIEAYRATTRCPPSLSQTLEVLSRVSASSVLARAPLSVRNANTMQEATHIAQIGAWRMIQQGTVKWEETTEPQRKRFFIWAMRQYILKRMMRYNRSDEMGSRWRWEETRFASLYLNNDRDGDAALNILDVIADDSPHVEWVVEVKDAAKRAKRLLAKDYNQQAVRELFAYCNGIPSKEFAPGRSQQSVTQKRRILTERIKRKMEKKDVDMRGIFACSRNR